MATISVGPRFPLLPKWQDAFLAASYQLTADRIGRIAAIAVVVNLLLFAAVDIRAWTNGEWDENPAFSWMFYWRVWFTAIALTYAVIWHFWRLSGGAQRFVVWVMILFTTIAGTSFTLIVQPIVKDSSIFALTLFVVASMFPVPSKSKMVIYPAALVVLLAGFASQLPTTISFLNSAINPACCTLFAMVVERMNFRSHLLNFVKERIIEEERGKSDRLLHNVLPDEIARRLRDAPEDTIVEFHGEVSVLFADVVGFTQMTAKLPASQLIQKLDELFLAFDESAERLGIEKIKTIGDSYMAACGVPVSTRNHAERVADLALEMLATIRRFDVDPELPLQMRIGMHSGPAIAGVIGRKKFCYDLWGDTVNTASRLESHGEASRIQVSEQIYHQLKSQFNFEPRGPVQLKGRGSMNTYFLLGRRPITAAHAEGLDPLQPTASAPAGDSAQSDQAS